jgi:hypothetical protein
LEEEEKEKQQEPQGKRKKMAAENKQSTSIQQQVTTHHTHKQQATKVLSNAAMTNDEKRFANLENKVINLQDTNVELVSTIREMREHQYRNQNKMIARQTELEATNRKSDITINKLNNVNRPLVM